MTAILLDTHVLYWLWAGETSRISGPATEVLGSADRLAVAAISWYELALLFERGRIELGDKNAGSVLASMADRVATEPISWPIAQRASELERSKLFPRDPADRLIFATAVERSFRLVTADERIRAYSNEVCIW